MPSLPGKFHSKPQKEKARLWQSGDLYRETQPFRTFTSDPANHSLLVDIARRNTHLIRISSGLEIGPGTRPIIPALPLREHVFLEKSQALAHGLRTTTIPAKAKGKDPTQTELPFSMFTGRKEKIVVGDINAPPFNARKQFGITVVNEVLTHVKPSDRIKILKNLIERSKGIVLVDRPQVPIHELRRKYEGAIGARKPKTNYFWRQEQARLVNFAPLVAELKKAGWAVTTQDKKSNGTTYTILEAKKTT